MLTGRFSIWIIRRRGIAKPAVAVKEEDEPSDVKQPPHSSSHNYSVHLLKARGFVKGAAERRLLTFKGPREQKRPRTTDEIWTRRTRRLVQSFRYTPARGRRRAVREFKRRPVRVACGLGVSRNVGAKTTRPDARRAPRAFDLPPRASGRSAFRESR